MLIHHHKISCGARTLLGAPGIATRNKDGSRAPGLTRSKKPLGTRSPNILLLSNRLPHFVGQFYCWPRAFGTVWKGKFLEGSVRKNRVLCLVQTATGLSRGWNCQECSER